MSASTEHPRRVRWLPTAIVTLLAAVVVLFVVIGVMAATGAPRSDVGAAPAASASTPASSEPQASESSSSKPSPASSARSSAVPSAAAEPTPQPTKTVTISKQTVIVKELTARVTKTVAVQGQAQGPGEIAGPSVRFTITLSNATGRSIDLSNTVVNAYGGADASPAIQLQGPGGKTFPKSLASGDSATGVFVFNIPETQRGRVQVTVDTSVKNPVVAFEGAAPR